MTDTRKEALVALLDKVETGVPNVFGRMSDAMLYSLEPQEINLIQSAYSGSLDAAKALHDVVLPGWEWEVNSSNMVEVWKDHDLNAEADAKGINPARAWLIAILKALIAEAAS